MRNSISPSVALLLWIVICVAQLSITTARASSHDDTEVTVPGVEKTKDPTSAKDTRGNWLPLPIFITEPAIGEGLGAALIYFHNEGDRTGIKATTAQEISKVGDQPKPPPKATGVFGVYTNQDSYAVGIGHTDSYLEDRYRLQAAAVDARFNSFYYIGDAPFGFTLEGDLLYANLKRRLGASNTFLGVTTTYANARATFNSDEREFEGIKLEDFDFIDAGLAVSIIYDTRNNTIMPGSGYIVDLTGSLHDEAIGGDFTYRTQIFKTNWYKKIGQNYVIGARLELSQTNGDTPFFAVPYVSLRGIPALRYQGDTTSTFELEARRRISDRWSTSIFAGSGSVDIRSDTPKTEDNIRAAGIGLRYLVIPKHDAWVGLDIARGPEDTVWYIQMGNAW